MLLADYEDSIVLVQYHIDDEYAAPWGSARRHFYGVGGKPVAWFDGDLNCVGAFPNLEIQYGWYEDQILERIDVPSEVSIDLHIEQVDGPLHIVYASICLEPNADPREVNVQMVQTFDHWPDYDPHMRNGFKQGAEPQTVTLPPAFCSQIMWTVAFDDESWERPEDIKIVAWAEDCEDDGPALIHQAFELSYADVIPTIPGDYNRDGTVDMGDFAHWMDCCYGPYETPEDSNYLAFDIDLDGDVDIEDFSRFQWLLAGVPTGCDYNLDGLVNLEDYSNWVPCLSGPDVQLTGACEVFDVDRDADVDLADFAAFQSLFDF